MTQNIELLAPAKNIEIAKAAIVHGADAVYIGGPHFGARHQAGNSLRDLAELVPFAHRFRAKVFVTVNTILHDSELALARAAIHDFYNIGVDALIIQDMGILEMDIPPIDLHASTQCDIRTPEKARFLADCGLSQLVLARELSLAEVAKIRAAVPEDVVLEYFIHGALCVAFSGLCNISHAHTGRSANRGDCSQACRLPYTLLDEQGRVVAFEKHLLSMKDNAQTDNLAALIAAGVRSFKIEGRYKDLAYVKNTTAHYRRALDEILAKNPELSAASSGISHCFFTPNLDKTFHRGHTDYFTQGRKDDIGAFDSPKFVGVALGEVVALGKAHLELATSEALHNGDGVNYAFKREQIGFLVNEAQEIAPNRWRLVPNEPLDKLKGLKIGTQLYRNRDVAWEKMLAKSDSAVRKMALSMRVFLDEAQAIALSLCDEDGVRVQVAQAAAWQAPPDEAAARARMQTQLSKLGAVDFALQALVDDLPRAYALPAAFWNALRREALAALQAARLAAYPRVFRRTESTPPPVYPVERLDFLANVFNDLARKFYERHGVKIIKPAFEAHQEAGEVSLMVTKHCLRFAFQLCPKQAKGVTGVMGQVRADPMILRSGKEEFKLRFDCRPCEMHVLGKIKKHILKSPPPSIVHFHPPQAKTTSH